MLTRSIFPVPVLTVSATDWSIWTAAISTTTAVRDLFISSVRKYAADGQSSQPLGDWYETTNGAVEGFRARPVVGGHLALVSVLCLVFVVRRCSVLMMDGSLLSERMCQ